MSDEHQFFLMWKDYSVLIQIENILNSNDENHTKLFPVLVRISNIPGVTGLLNEVIGL